MTRINNNPGKPKLSAEFRARLNRLGPEQKVKAVVLLESNFNSSGRRQSRAERKAALDAVRESSEAALKYVDEILESFKGRRLSESPNALGSVLIEGNAAGIVALAESEYVKAILEDQPISSLVRTDRL